jgi:hypothetical protein
MRAGGRLRAGLKGATASAALPYGFTLATWTAGAVVSHERGIPTALYAFLFMFGAVVAFVLISLIAYGSIDAELEPASNRLRLWQGFHVFAVGLSITAVWVVSDVVTHDLVWPLAGFVMVAVFLLVAGTMRALEPARSSERPTEAGSRPPTG